jgi:hypothetical protein
MFYTDTENKRGFLMKYGQINTTPRKRWVEITKKKLLYYEVSKNMDKTLKGEILLNDVAFVSACEPPYPEKYLDESNKFHFRVGVVNSKRANVTPKECSIFYFSADDDVQRTDWMLCIGDTSAQKTIQLFDQYGYLFVSGLNNGRNTSWVKCSVVLNKLILEIIPQNDGFKNEIIDLRKVLMIKEWKRFDNLMEKGNSICICVPQRPAFYLQADYENFTDIWINALTKVPQNGLIAEQFLTLENVPIFFDKCIRFVDAFGLTKEGVYRINGQKKNYTVLVEQSLSNYQTICNLEIYSYLVEDITSAVKLFLRTFSECLLTELLYKQWGSLSEIKCEQTRLKNITLLLSQIPKVNAAILKLLVAHLRRVVEYSDINKMNIDNIARVFWPTILYSTSESLNSSSDYSDSGIVIVSDMITHYDILFNCEKYAAPQSNNHQNNISKNYDKIEDDNNKPLLKPRRLKSTNEGNC